MRTRIIHVGVLILVLALLVATAPALHRDGEPHTSSENTRHYYLGGGAISVSGNNSVAVEESRLVIRRDCYAMLRFTYSIDGLVEDALVYADGRLRGEGLDASFSSLCVIGLNKPCSSTGPLSQLTDMPLKLKPGTYVLSLKLEAREWIGTGEIRVTPTLVVSEDSSPLPRIIVPAYYYPVLWDKGSREYEYWASTLQRSQGLIVILNPGNGPGGPGDRPPYSRVLEEILERGGIPIGYVYTGYAGRPIGAVKQDIDRWLSLYPGIKGFFIDEASEQKGKIQYYLEIYRYVKEKSPSLLVVLNPGTPPSPLYNNAADAIVVYEDRYRGRQALQEILEEAARTYRNPIVILQGLKSRENYDQAAEALAPHQASLAALYLYQGSSIYDRPSKWLSNLAGEELEPRRTPRSIAQPVIEARVTGPSPSEETGEWMQAEGSTRTITMLINPEPRYTGNNTYEARLWIWAFSPSSTGPVKAQLRVENSLTGTNYWAGTVLLEPEGDYLEAAVSLYLRPGSYRVEAVVEGSVLTGELTAPPG